MRMQIRIRDLPDKSYVLDYCVFRPHRWHWFPVVYETREGITLSWLWFGADFREVEKKREKKSEPVEESSSG